MLCVLVAKYVSDLTLIENTDIFLSAKNLCFSASECEAPFVEDDLVVVHPEKIERSSMMGANFVRDLKASIDLGIDVLGIKDRWVRRNMFPCLKLNHHFLAHETPDVAKMLEIVNQIESSELKAATMNWIARNNFGEFPKKG